MAQPDFYTLLGVPRNATSADLKRAYRRLAVTWHPDRNSSPLAESRFKAISEAYAVLSNPAKRHKYDLLGPEEFRHEFSQEDIFKGFDIGDLFRQFGLEDSTQSLKRIFKGASTALTTRNRVDGARAELTDFFSGFGHKAGAAGDRRSPDIVVPLVVTFREACLGGEKTVAYNTPQGPVKTRITLEPGLRDGRRIVLKRQGPAQPGARPGDLIVNISVIPDPDFSRRGFDLGLGLALSPAERAQGAKPVIKTLEGQSLRLTIPPGVKVGDRFKVPGRGIMKEDGRRGDLIVSIKEKK